MADWNRRFMDLAEHVSEWSKDRSTKVGAVIVGPDREIVSMGYNGFARGVNDDSDIRHERPLKYFFTVHAEENCLYNTNRTGAKVFGCSIYVSSLPPCARCSSAIAQSGIRTVYCIPLKANTFLEQRWRDEINVGAFILREAGVAIEYMEN